MPNDWIDNNEVICVKAEFDKATKTTWRYNIIDNKHKVSGLLYLKSNGRNEQDAPEILAIKMKEK